MNARLAAGLRDLPRTYLLDISDVVMRRPGGAFDNPKMRHLARMRLGEGVLLDLAKSYAGYIAPLKGLTRKCVVLDLDNTLWGGIVGEDGPHGIRLGDTSPGSEYREFQRYLRILVERGILLAINSKNNPEDALEVIQRHDAMILRADSFSAVEINWQPKPDNMQRIARTLGLGLDTFVFVDDSPKERALMRHALPQVLTPELPADPARYRPTLERLPQLQALVVTDEDRTRTIQYLARREREQVRVTAHDLDEYLRSLDIVIEVGRASTATLSRVHQLFQRTNQFNLTGRRYELGTLTALAEDDDYRLYVAKASDRFGDHGLVASALVRLEGSQWLVENFVMSCRVIGYGVEGALLARLSKDAQDSGAAMLVGQYLETAKNAPARDFYTLHSFAPSDVSNGVHRWCRDLADGPVPTPAWITVRTARAS
jgi:FkbH-like protein